MSGHSKWHNIQKTKGAQDAKRAAAFTKIAKEQGLSLIDAGHFATENPVVSVLTEKIAAAFPETQVKISETHADCMKYY